MSETAWLIELPSSGPIRTLYWAPVWKPKKEPIMVGDRDTGLKGVYWRDTAHNSRQVTDDPNKAIRFARKEDAEAVIKWLDEARLLFGNVIATEHEWVAPASPKPVQVAVAWRAWGSPWSNKPENQCWCYWDEYPETIPNSPDFTKFQALYTHPATGQELREELERLIDKWQDQRSGRPGWNAQQDCADDLRALLSRSTKEGEV